MINFAPLLTDLNATGNDDAVLAGIKALNAHKTPDEFSDDEWAALAVIGSGEQHTMGRTIARKLLAQRPHAYIANW